MNKMGLLLDLKHAVRLTALRPVFSMLAIIIVAMSLGVSIYSSTLVWRLVLKDVPFENGSRMFTILLSSDGTAHGKKQAIDLNILRSIRSQSQSFDILDYFNTQEVNLGSGETRQTVKAAVVNPVFFDFVSVQATSDDFDTPVPLESQQAPIVIISHHLAQNAFTGSSQIVGSDLLINARPHKIAGILPEGFTFPSRTDVWLLFDKNQQYNRDEKVFVTPFALLKQGVTVENATLELATLFAKAGSHYGTANSPYRPVLLSFPMSLIGDGSKGLISLVLIAVLIMLGLTCTNIATLLYARSQARAKEIALRMALGAANKRIALLLVWESAIIAISGGVLGLLMAQASLDFTADIIEARAAQLPAFFWSLQIDGHVLLLSAVLIAVITLISGLAPAWRFFSNNVNTLLKEGVAEAKQHGDSRFVKSVMLLTVALSCCLFGSAIALFDKSRSAQQADYGVNPSPFITLRVGVVEPDFNRQVIAEFFSSLMTKLKNEPGVSGVFGANPLPGQPALYRKIDLQGQNKGEVGQQLFANSAELTPGTMQTLEIPLLAGRYFNQDDGFEAPPVAIVTRTFVEDAGLDIEQILGSRVRFSIVSGNQPGPWLTVVGVSDHLIYGNPYGFRTGFSTVITPAAQNPWRFMSIGFDHVSDPLELIDTVERNIEQLGSNAVVIDAMPYAQLLQQNTLMLSFVSVLYLIFALLAVALSTGSFYGIVQEQAQSRAFELGVRQAIGATQRQVIFLVMKGICTLLLAGCIVGGVISYFVIEGLYQQMQIMSPVAQIFLYVCPLLLFCFMTLITFLAVKTVVANEPAEALRYE